MLGYWVLIASVVTGQITRIGDLGVLTDILIPLYLVFWFFTRDKKRPLPFSSSILLVLIWLIYLLAWFHVKNSGKLMTSISDFDVFRINY